MAHLVVNLSDVSNVASLLIIVAPMFLPLFLCSEACIIEIVLLKCFSFTAVQALQGPFCPVWSEGHSVSEHI